VRPLLCAVLALGLLVAPALAQDNPYFNWHAYRQFDNEEIPAGDPYLIFNHVLIEGEETTAVIVPRDVNPRWCGELRIGPPGHEQKSLPFAELWGYAVAESGIGWSGSECDVQWRWRTWFPEDYTVIYHGAWTPIFNVMGTHDSLYVGPIWGGDTLGWFADIEFRAWGGRTNDSTYLTFWVSRRTWK
jgi:hypothetical protein